MQTFNKTNQQQDKPKQKSGQQVYFQGAKKNQIQQIKIYFKSILNNPDHAYFQKQLIKKIISYTTIGIDTSRLYPEMVLASGTKDIIEKKLIFFYLSKYSSKNADFARMAVNTFMKDTFSPNPNIRALAIRHLSNLRFKGRQQYLMPILMKGLTDLCPQVKKSCAMGIAKVITQRYRKQQEAQRQQQLLNTLYGLLRDSDPNTICIILEAINEIEPEGIAMSKKLTFYLVQNLTIFNQMQLAVILKFIQLYDPKNDEQLYQILNTIVGKIKSPSLCVVLAVSKIFLKYAKAQPKLEKDLMDKIKISIISFVNHQTPQIQWVALKHILELIELNHTQVFVSQTKKFFVRSNQPSYLKSMKIKLLEKNCRDSNLNDILNQLCEYLLDEDISKDAALALDLMILKSKTDSNTKLIAKNIIKTIQNSSKQFLCNNCLPTLRNFLRKCPQELGLLQSIFYKLVQKTSSDDARIALIQIIGDYGDQIEDAIQLLAMSEDSKTSDSVKISLIQANVKIFFKRPYQTLHLLTNLFKQLLGDDSLSIHIKDYIAYIYRALQSDPQQFRKTYCQNIKNLNAYKQPLFEQLQFNTLETVYEKKQRKWIIGQNKGYQIQQIEYAQNLQIEDGIDPQAALEDSNFGLDISQLPKRNVKVDLSSKFKQLEAQDFDVEFEMSANEYQTCWQNYQIGASITRIVKNMEMISQQTLEELFKLWNISVIASAEDQQSIKLYLFCKLNQGEIACMQFQVLKQAQTMTLLIKSQNQELGGFVFRYIQEFLKLNDII